MSHVDEGRLHEYVDRLERQADARIGGWADGEEIEAHLAECAECRERLEQVRTLKEQAAALLSAAAPVDVAMPQFAEIQARARTRQAPRRVFTVSRIAALSWAATVVLAVGVGWLARGSLSFQRPQVEDLHPVIPSVAEAPTDAPLVDAGTAEAASGHGTETDAAFSETEPRRGAEEATAQEAVPPVAAREGREPAAAPPAELQRTEPQVPTAANIAEREQPRAAKAETPEGIRARQAVIGAVVTADERRDVLGRGGVLTDSAANEMTHQVDDALLTKSWQAATASDAEQHLGGPLRTVEGLPIESIRLGDVGGQPAVTVVQILPGREQLEIVQWPLPDADRLGGQWLMAQAADVAVTRDGFILVLRAPLSVDSLRVLAARVSPPASP